MREKVRDGYGREERRRGKAREKVREKEREGKREALSTKER